MSAPDRSITRAVVRRLVSDELRTAIGWSTFYALIVYASAAGYVSAYGSLAERAALQASLGGNAGLAALFGQPHTLATVGGFTAWRSEGILLIVGAVWGAFLGARIFRGHEESGRWEYVVAGRTDRVRATRAAVAAVVVVLGIVWIGTALAAIAASRLSDAGFGVGGAALLATELVGPAVLFTTVSALTAQAFATRRQAAAAAGVVFGVLFCLRLAAGVYPAQTWLRWVNPLQWFDSVGALADPAAAWLLPAFALPALCAAIALTLARRRDVGAALIEDRPPRHARPIHGVEALALRLTQASAAGWLAIVAALAAMVGILAGPVADATAGSAAMRRILGQLAGRSSGARAFLGLTMLTIGTLLCLSAASLVASVVDEETSGRLEGLLAEPVRRARWLAGRVAAALSVLLGCGLLVGVVVWATSSATGSVGAGFTTLVRAGLNLVPVAVVILAVGVATYGVRPRLAGAAAHGLVAASFALELVGALVRAPGWLLDLSVFHHLALAPAVEPRWGTGAVMLMLAGVLVGAGVLRMCTRDVVAG